MAYVEPKTDWNETYEPGTNDMNRIEGNTKQNHEDIDAEESARISADNTLQDNIDAEESARISADNDIDSKVTNVENIVAYIESNI